ETLGEAVVERRVAATAAGTGPTVTGPSGTTASDLYSLGGEALLEGGALRICHRVRPHGLRDGLAAGLDGSNDLRHRSGLVLGELHQPAHGARDAVELRDLIHRVTWEAEQCRREEEVTREVRARRTERREVGDDVAVLVEDRLRVLLVQHVVLTAAPA